MKNPHISIVIAATVAAMLLIVPETAAQTQAHRAKNDAWVDCLPDSPAMSWEEAFTAALAEGYRGTRSCAVVQKHRFLFIRWTTRHAVVTVTVTDRKDRDKEADKVGLFSFPCGGGYNKNAYRTMKILSIETSCDETGIALIDATGPADAPRVKVSENLVTTQIPIHREFGGVVPNLAKREHLKNLPLLLARLRAEHPRLAPDLIAVTVGPGLEPALWTGITFAQTLAEEYGVPLVGANHLEGHLYSFLLPPQRKKVVFPAVALIVSGGHTILLKMDSFTEWKRLGETRDDAAGEAFDKVARLLGLPYPGGPEVETLARKGDPDAIPLPRPMLHEKNFDFSFSGLKTAVLYYLRDHPDADKAAVAASFQKAAFDVLVKKTMRAAAESGARSVILCGGVAANKALRARLAREAEKAGIAFLVPEFKYNLDNAAMIGLAGYMAHLRGKRRPMQARGDMEI